MTPLAFGNKRLPWRIVVPAKLNGGKRKVEYFKDKQAAKDRIKEIELDGRSAITKFGQYRTAKQQDQLTRLIEYASEKLGGDLGRVFEAIDFFTEHRLNLVPAIVKAALAAYITKREKEVTDGMIGAGTLADDRYRLRKLEDELGLAQMSDLTKPILLDFFGKFNPKLRRTIYKSVRPFINWAHENKYLAENPLATVKPKKEIGEFGVNKGYYQVETFRRMLRVAAGLEAPKEGAEPTRKFIDLLPWFVVSGFGGLRSCEAFRDDLKSDSLRKSDLYFDRAIPFLDVREEVAKQTQKEEEADGRPVDADFAIAAIKDWLSLVPATDSPFAVPHCERQIHALKKEFMQATGIKFLKNGFRNSFATYGLSYSGLTGLGLIAKQMGNSEAIVKKHYVRALPAETGKAWFNLRPFEPVQEQERRQA